MPLSSRQAWPEGSYKPYRIIVYHQQLLELMINTALEGAKKQNRDLVVEFWPEIEEAAVVIRQQAELIYSLLPTSRRGRLPKWAVIMDEIEALAISIINRCRTIEVALRTNKLIVIRAALECQLAEANAIKAELAGHPDEPESPLTDLEGDPRRARDNTPNETDLEAFIEFIQDLDLDDLND